MTLVIIESPYAGDIKANMEYAHQCVKDCIIRGESPYASHIMLTTALDDMVAEQRSAGIQAGLQWAVVADLIAVYTDLGISNGMVYAITRHKLNNRRIEYRSIR